MAGSDRIRSFASGVLPIAALVLLAGCDPEVPDSGVGFETYPQYMQERSAAATAAAVPAGPAPVTTITPPPPAMLPAPPLQGSSGVTAMPLPAAGAASYPAPVAAPAPAAAVAAAPAAVPPAASGGISDEQDFSAVAARETIESDKARIEANKANYTQIEPAALPERSTTGPNIVAYAIGAPNRLGESVYPRSGLHLSNFERACARFPSQDLAQIEFLKSGGPEKDPKNLDPDGDGFACRWDPTPFQKPRG